MGRPPQSTITLIWGAHVALILLLTTFVAHPMQVVAGAKISALPWIIGVATSIAGVIYANLKVRPGMTMQKRQTELLIAMALVEVGALAGVFIFVPQGYPYWAPAALAIPGLLLIFPSTRLG